MVSSLIYEGSKVVDEAAGNTMTGWPLLRTSDDDTAMAMGASLIELELRSLKYRA